PWVVEVVGQLGMEVEAAVRQPVESAAAAPVARQEAARLAGGGPGHGVPFDHDGLGAAGAEAIGDGRADGAAAADHDAFATTHEGISCICASVACHAVPVPV